MVSLYFDTMHVLLCISTPCMYYYVFRHHVHCHWNITFQILTTDSLLHGLITQCNLSGRSLISRFLSEPMRLVKSYTPLPFPSAFLFSQTLFSHKLRLSRMSHSRASLTKLFVRMSKCLKQNKNGLDGIILQFTSLPTWNLGSGLSIKMLFKIVQCAAVSLLSRKANIQLLQDHSREISCRTNLVGIIRWVCTNYHYSELKKTCEKTQASI